MGACHTGTVHFKCPANTDIYHGCSAYVVTEYCHPVSSGNKRAWGNIMTMSAWCPRSTIPSAPTGYIEGAAFAQNAFRKGKMRFCFIRPSLLDTLRIHYAPSALLSLRDYYPAAPSKFLSVAARWRAHQQYLKTCWSSSAARKAVIVERFCGLRLASWLCFPLYIL